ncbi:DegT/DnrJ/EryC1/StrS family aminotransferase [Roseobacter sp. OBYS 0001]|uniref:DegT/DnrJ/EryC1/StrS family aminotransferase n=1 Tax=Roseobacter sp. OBYS 0001 TaxID=882651 RepID=UPI001BB90C22|nr:DegT/DnrJ/EryC1/StrS family aminotransferase [Roseobacter sp. OBYS 0001]GIT88877.1 aminotransferase DegT [Roseobacter sp. OBYS 0001]
MADSKDEKILKLGEQEIEELKNAIKLPKGLWAYSNDAFYGSLAKGLDELKKHFRDVGGGDVFLTPTSSGTASIQVALGALKIPAGSEVIVTPITDPGSVNPIIFHNAIPVFADVDPRSGLITPETVKAKLTHRTRAVIAVHLTGSAVDVPGIRAMLDEEGHGKVLIIEDVAQGLGASLDGKPLGTLGDAGCFSLNHWKHITTGEGGFVLTKDKRSFYSCMSFADKHRDRLNSPYPEDGIFKGFGHSMRLSQLDGAMLLAQVPKLERMAEARRRFGLALDAEIRKQTDLVPQTHLTNADPSFFGYMFATPTEVPKFKSPAFKEKMKERLGALGFRWNGSSYNYYDLPIFEYDAFKTRNFGAAEAIDPRTKCPIWPAEIVSEMAFGKIDAKGKDFFDYTHEKWTDCPNAKSYLKRSFWISMNETSKEEDAAKIAKVLAEMFQP